MGERQQEHGEALREIVFHPAGELGGAFGVLSDDLLEPLFGRGTGGGFKDTADGAGHFGALIQARDVSLGVLLEVELAALPGDGAKDGLAGGGHAGMIVADDEGDAAQAALDQALEEGPPMHLGFTEGDADAEDGALALGSDAQGNEDGAVAELAVVADFFVTGVEHEIGTGTQWPVAPLLQFGVELFGAFADLGGTDGRAAELLDNGGDFAGGNPLDVHFGHGEFEGLFGAEAFLQGAGIKVGFTPDLRHAEGDGADAAGEGFGFVAVGVTFTGVGALVGLGLEDLMAFEAHGFVDEQAQAFGEAVVALFSQQLQNVVQEFRIVLVGHFGFELAVFRDTPTGNQFDPPSTSFSRAERLHPSGVRLRSARYARLRSASPRRGGGGGKKDKLQKDFYTPTNPGLAQPTRYVYCLHDVTDPSDYTVLYRTFDPISDSPSPYVNAVYYTYGLVYVGSLTPPPPPELAFLQPATAGPMQQPFYTGAVADANSVRMGWHLLYEFDPR